ncbi:Ig-like domain-containing protein [Myxococcota bacterium]|nr:Ig-like domain-containing protein [Myxococcota bacterium]
MGGENARRRWAWGLALVATTLVGCTDGTLVLDDDDDADDDASGDPVAVAFAGIAEGDLVNGTATVGADVTGGASPYSVALSLDDSEVGTDDSGPYSFEWDTTSASRGEHALSLVVTDGNGDEASATVTVTVDQLPTIVITAPGEGEGVTGLVTLAAEVEDDGTGAVVEASLDGVVFAVDDVAPYEGIVDSCTALAGSHVLSAVVTDSAGQVASDEIGVEIERSDADGDGADACLDCDDSDASVHPGAVEVCGDAIDQDCDGSLGSCPIEIEDVVGRTYAVDYATGTVTEPAGVGAYLDEYLGYLGVVLLQATSASEDGDAIHARLAPALDDGVGWVQDVCQPSVDMPGAPGSFTNPGFTVGPAPLYVGYEGFVVDLEESTFSAEFAGVSALASGALHTAFDTRYVDSFVGSDGTTCGILSGLGVLCEGCPDEGDPYCIYAVISGLEAAEVPGLDVVPRSAEEIAADSGC